MVVSVVSAIVVDVLIGLSNCSVWLSVVLSGKFTVAIVVLSGFVVSSASVDVWSAPSPVV